MNTHAEYRRHSYQPSAPSVPALDTDTVTSELAHHRDPSLAADGEAPTPTRGIAWVRPTDLATYAAPMVGRGIDLHAELIRRARRTPATTTRAVQRGIPHSTSRTPPTNRTEGLSL